MKLAGGVKRPLGAWCAILASALMYVIGRSQGIIFLEVASVIPILCGVVALLWGVGALRAQWFALFFMCFMIPLPGALVDALTQPMKLAVSYAAEHILYGLGYPISRDGVILMIGPYQMLVADACAGLHTLFTLEAMGLFYLNVTKSSSFARNVTLGVLIVPLSFLANVIRVICLMLITYYWGDAAGQGFLHGFAGVVLFLAALILIVLADMVINWVLAARGSRQGAAS